MYSIGDFSRLCKVTVETLRYYDRIGILTPDYIDKFTGYRYYYASKLNEFYSIVILKETGFSLDEIKEFLTRQKSPDISSLLLKKKDEINMEIQAMEEKLKKLDYYAQIINQEGGLMKGNVIIKKGNKQKFAVRRQIFPDRGTAYEEINNLQNLLAAKGIKCGDVTAIINHDLCYCTENLDLEIGVSFAGKLPEINGIREKFIDIEKDYASAICDNSIKDIEQVYAYIIGYANENKYNITDSYMEIYHDSDTVEILVHVEKIEPVEYTDDPELPFINDEVVTGRWEFFDKLADKEQFSENKINRYNGWKWFNEIYFLPKGEKYWVFGWTKGYIIHSSGDYPRPVYNKYEIREVSGIRYMLIEFKKSNSLGYNIKPEIYVLRQTDNKSYTKSEIRKYDNTDFPFVDDTDILGKWQSVDFVDEIEDFNPSKKVCSYDLFLKTIEFIPEGDLEKTNINESYFSKWTRGHVLDLNLQLDEVYFIKIIEEKEYLFLQWKNGDYYFSGRKPKYYVFVKVV